MKKLAIWLLLVLVAAMFTSCSSDSDSSTEPTNPATNTVTCSIITPTDNSGVQPGKTVNCQFKVKAKTELIVDVRFFVDGTLTGTMSGQSTPQDTLKTYNWTIPSNFTGSHKIWAIARNSAGIEGKSAELNIFATGTLTVTNDSINLGNTMVGSSSSEQSFSVSGSNLQSAVTITAPDGFEISKTSGSGFGTTLSLALTGGNVPSTTIFVRFNPTIVQSYNGTITCVSGLATQNVSVIGTAMQTIYSMVFVNGGTFQMGSAAGDDNEQPVHSVTLSPFYISKYEVTQSEWLTTMDYNPSFFSGNMNRPVELVSWYEILIYCNKRSIAENLTPCYTINNSTDPSNWGSIPSNSSNIYWDQVICNWNANGYRLPSEAEWEFAARGGNSSQGYTYSGSNTVGEVAWYDGNSTPPNSSSRTYNVGTKAPNELGIYDMSGNVFEWIFEWYGYYSANAQNNPHSEGPGSTIVVRGGCYDASDYFSRVSFRGVTLPYNRSDNLGFRLVRSL